MFRKRFVIPGEFLASSKEYGSGKGTFISNNKIFASQLGIAYLNTKTRTINIDARNPPSIISLSDVVIGTVTEVKTSMVIVNIEHIIGKQRSISMENTGSIYISDVSASYTKTLSTEFKVNDIIRAKVIQVKPSIHLTTTGREYGVIMAYCEKCGIPMDRSGNVLICNRCHAVARRKLSTQYGKYEEIFKEDISGR